MDEETEVVNPIPRICANCKFWGFEGPSWKKAESGVCERITTLHTRSPAEIRGPNNTQLVTTRDFCCSLFVEIAPPGS